MKKTGFSLIAILFGLACAFSLAGCSGGSGSSPGSPPSATPPGDTPTDEEPAGEEPADEEPADGGTTSEEPADEEPVGGGTAGGGTAGGGTAGEEPADGKPKDEEPPTVATPSLTEGFSDSELSDMGLALRSSVLSAGSVPYGTNTSAGTGYISIVSGGTGAKGDFHASYDKEDTLDFFFSHEIDGQGLLSDTKDTTVLFTRSDGTPENGWNGVEAHELHSQANFSVDEYWVAYSDIEDGEDTDYLSIGYWRSAVMDPLASVYWGNYQWGVSASGTDVFNSANIVGLTGDATYVGPATGLYMREETAGSTPEFESFGATARLVAGFGDSTSRGGISGTISGGSTTGGVDLPELTLNDATPNQGGNFRSKVSGTTMLGTREIDIYGSWGGQFFGNGATASDAPGSVAGVFTAKYDPADPDLLTTDERITILGALGAYHE